MSRMFPSSFPQSYSNFNGKEGQSQGVPQLLPAAQGQVFTSSPVEVFQRGTTQQSCDGIIGPHVTSLAPATRPLVHSCRGTQVVCGKSGWEGTRHVLHDSSC